MPKEIAKHDKPFPLKRYYFIYAGSGTLIFYVLLFSLFITAERTALYQEYIHSVSQKAKTLYMDIERDFFVPHKINIENFDPSNIDLKEALHEEIQAIVAADFALAKVKLFRSDALTFYDQEDRKKEGFLYDARKEKGFISALNGEVAYKIEQDNTNRKLIELYLPIFRLDTRKVVAVLELYEDISRFDNQVRVALQRALVLPTLVFIIFNVALFYIIAKADRIIARNTSLLVAIRQNMEKYLSQSAVSAITQAVSTKQELFRGERQELVIFFSDVRGFTSLSENTNPENVVLMLNKIFELQANILHQYGGIIDKFVGDEIMAIFPANREADAIKAVMAVLEAIEVQENINVSIGIGIHSGEAVVGSLGSPERRDYTAIGDTINIGARLCAASPPGCAVVSSETYNNLPDQMKTLFPVQQTLNLKGKAEPFSVYITQSSKEKKSTLMS